VYQTVPGWMEEIRDVKKFEDLPKTAQDYVKTVEQIVGVPIKMIGIGPKRSDILYR
jgi:adenylosuccinate synthase